VRGYEVSKRAAIPQSRKHVHIYDDDWAFLASVYNRENGSSIRGPSHAIREIVHRQVEKIRANSEAMIDKARAEKRAAEEEAAKS
jgi:hypothetical protein